MANSDAAKTDPSMLGQTHYKRADLDHYPTPARATEALLKAIGEDLMPYLGWEPACGNGAVSSLVAEHFREFVSTDIQAYAGFDPAGLLDFTSCTLDDIEAIAGFRPDGIITNPPYGKDAEKFARHALKLMEPGQGLVIFLCRHEWDCAKGRSDLFDHPAFAMKITMRFRPRWIADSDGAPRFPYAWYVWDFTKPVAAKPELIYVD